MQWLHASDYSELAEAWNIGCRWVFDMLDPVSHILRSILGGRTCISIERQANRTIANCMGENLNTCAIQFRDKLFVFSRVPQQFTRKARVIRVGRQHSGCMR